eukprot:3469653-Pleurochrysis_carterae.AAC.4
MEPKVTATAAKATAATATTATAAVATAVATAAVTTTAARMGLRFRVISVHHGVTLRLRLWTRSHLLIYACDNHAPKRGDLSRPPAADKTARVGYASSDGSAVHGLHQRRRATQPATSPIQAISAQVDSHFWAGLLRDWQVVGLQEGGESSSLTTLAKDATA